MIPPTLPYPSQRIKIPLQSSEKEEEKEKAPIPTVAVNSGVTSGEWVWNFNLSPSLGWILESNRIVSFGFCFYEWMEYGVPIFLSLPHMFETGRCEVTMLLYLLVCGREQDLWMGERMG